MKVIDAVYSANDARRHKNKVPRPVLLMPLSPKSLSEPPLWLRRLTLLAFCAVIAHYFWFLNSHATNIPYQDDISDLVRFITQVESAENGWIALEAWFRQYNEHRVGATRLLVYAVYLIEGEMNFHTLMIVANLALPLILFLFYLGIKNDEQRWVYLLVAALLLVNLKHYTLAFMSQAAFAYYYVFLYAFACVFTLHRVTKVKFVVAAVFCFLSSFSLASGQIVWLIGLASLLHQCLLSGRRSLWYPLVWVVISIVMLVVWHWGYTVSEVEISADKVRAVFPDYMGDATLYEALPRYAAFFLAFTGSALVNFSALLSGICGAAMLALLVYMSLKNLQGDDIRLELCCWFAVATLAAATVGRALFIAPDTLLHVRYNFFSVMLVCPLALLMLTRFAIFRTHAMYIVVMLALLFSVSAWRDSEGQLNDALNSLYGYFNEGRYPVAGMSVEANAIMKEAISAGIYNPPCRPFPACEIPASPGSAQ